MDWLTFVAVLVEHLAWPVTILVVFLVLRKPLAGLIPLLVRLRYKDLELDFSRRLEEVTAEVQELPRADTTARIDDPLLRLAESSPRAAILESWLRLETAAVDAARRKNVAIPPSHVRSPLQLVQSLEELGIVDARQAALFHDLRGLRNSAAHAMNFDPGIEASREYVLAASRLEEYLQSA